MLGIPDIIYPWISFCIAILCFIFLLAVGLACVQFRNANRLARQRDEEMIAKAAAAGFGSKGGRSRPCYLSNK